MGQAVIMHEPTIPVAISVRGRAAGQEWEQGPPDVMVALRGGDGGSSRGQRVVTSELIIRRLSPLERDRLMDWPDDYTRWGLYDDGQVREVATTNRDRITGNGVVAGVTEWIGRRLPAEGTP